MSEAGNEKQDAQDRMSQPSDHPGNYCTVPLVCPLCQKPLEMGSDKIDCSPCDREDCPGSFEYCEGFPDLVIGDRFDDPYLPDRMCYEESCNEYSAIHYWVPLFKQLLPEGGRILSVGCGVGTEVEIITRAGFECVGIDNGNRTSFWPRRECRNTMLLANGLYLPFEDEYFDLVFCGCVFAHVGVVGDSHVVAENYTVDRQKLASEMARVTRPGGSIVAATPNRHFPLDIFHGREEGSYRPRLNPPGDKFLLSGGDFKKMFVGNAGCKSLEMLPVEGFWGFIRADKGLKGKLFGMPVKIVFKMLAKPWLALLRGSIIDPWITVRVIK